MGHTAVHVVFHGLGDSSLTVNLRGWLLVLADKNITASLDVASFIRLGVSHSASLWLCEVLLELAFAVHLDTLLSLRTGHDLVKGSVVCHAASIASFLRPKGLMAITKADIRLFHQRLIAAMLLEVDFSLHFFQSSLRHMCDLEGVLRRQIVLHIS